MNKKSKYALYGAASFGIGNAILNVLKQLNRTDDDPNSIFDWTELLGAGLKGAAVGGIGGLAVGAIVDYQNSLEEPINTDAFFSSLLEKIRLKKTNTGYRQLDGEAASLIDSLKDKFGKSLAGEPKRLGSTENGTALIENFDIDICLPFKSNSFRSTNEMFSRVSDYTEELVGKQSVISSREQKKSIGIILDINSKKHRIDIVPLKLTKKRGNKTSGYLFFNDPNNPSYTKTDVRAVKSLTLTETQKKILVILKHWKGKDNVPMSSHLLQNFILDAYKRNTVPRKFTQKVIMVLRHIQNKMDVAVIRSIENTNNVLTNISESRKEEIVQACKKVIEEYEYQPNSIIEFFKVR